MKRLRLPLTWLLLLTLLFFPHAPARAVLQTHPVPARGYCDRTSSVAEDPWFTIFGPPVQITDTPDVDESWPSIAVDAAGNVHLAFEAEGSIRYTRNVCGRFLPSVPVSTGVSDAQRPSLALGADGRVHISFAAERQGYGHDIYYTVGTGSTFSAPVRVGEAGWPQLFVTPALGVDQAGWVHIGFGSESEVWYVHNTGGSFAAPVPIASGLGEVGPTELAIDPLGQVHVAFSTDDLFLQDPAVYYVNNVGGGFGGVIKVADREAPPHGLSLAVDGAGQAHIAYAEGSLSYVFYTTNAHGAFSDPVAVTWRSIGPALALDSEGKVHMGLAPLRGLVGYSNNRSGSFGWSEAASGDDMGELNGPVPSRFFQVDAADRGHLVYSDGGELYYRTADVTTLLPFPVSVAQTPDVIDTLPALALDRLGNVHIAYMGTYASPEAPDGVSTDIFYTHNMSGSFATALLVQAPDSSSGFYSKDISLAVDGQGKAHLTFIRTVQQTGGAGDLIYATNAQGDFQSVLFPLGWGVASTGASVAVDRDDHVHIAYQASVHDIYYTNNISSPFSERTRVCADVSFGTDPTIAVDADGNAHIAFIGYRTQWEQEVFYTDNTAGGFHPPVNVSQDPEHNHSWPTLDVDGSGVSHLAYRTTPDVDNQLYYVNNASGAFAQPVAIPGTGWAHRPCLDIDAAGHVYIAHLCVANEVCLAHNQGGDFRVRQLTQGLWTLVPGRGWFAIDQSGIGHFAFYDYAEPFEQMDTLYLRGNVGYPLPWVRTCGWLYLPAIFKQR